jgi:hypothetical protein
LPREIIPDNIDEEMTDELIKSITDRKSRNGLNGRRNNYLILKSVGN